MSSFKVLLDADVLFPAPVRGVLLGAAEADLYRPHWSDEILDEVHRNLIKKQKASQQQADDLIDAIRSAFPDAIVRGYQKLIPVMTNDPGDRHVLAAAVRAKAQVLVTRNIKHFPAESVADYDIEIQTPDTFLLNQVGLDPNRMVQVVAEQARSLRNPPKTVFEVLTAVGWHAPQFAEAVRGLLENPSSAGGVAIRYLAVPIERGA